MLNSARLLEKMKAYIGLHKENTAKVLKGLQFEMFCALYDFLTEGNTEGYFVAPTGFGKTVIMTQIVQALQEEVYILVPTRPLLHQTQDELSLFCDGITSGLVYGLKKQFGKKVTIFTYSTFQRLIHEGKIDATKIGLLLLDEPHMCLTEKRMEAVNMCTNAIKLGFTASPFYSEEKNTDMLLKKLIFAVSIKQGVEEGFLAPFRVIIAETDTDLSEVKMGKGKEYDQHLLAKAINIERRNLAAVKLHKETPEFRGQSTLVHCVDIRHALTVAKLFRKNGYRAQAVHSKMDEKKVGKILSKFKSGRIQILCDVDMLGVGFNAPIASICFNLRPTRSVVVATQRPRNLRIDPKNPLKFAYVVDFFDSDERGQYAISYADIAEGTYHLPKKSSRNGTSARSYVIKNLPNVEGLKIHTTSRKIYEITNSNLRKGKLTYEVWCKELKEFGIKGWKHYQDELPNHPLWPKQPYHHYPEFHGFAWGKSPFLTFEDFTEEVTDLGISTFAEYSKEWDTGDHPKWPSNPEATYKMELFTESVDYEKKFLKRTKLLEELESLVNTSPGVSKFFYGERWEFIEKSRQRKISELLQKIEEFY